jgi:CBS domain-containing protein
MRPLCINKYAIGSPLDLSHKNAFYSVMLESPLSAAIEILAADNGVHRVNVVDGNGRVQGILSQSDVIKFLLSKKDLFRALMGKSLVELGIDQCPVVSVKAESSVLDALQRMSEHYISSVAVVDPAGTLVGSISMADIRFIFQHGRYHRLWMNCSQFLTLALSQKGLEHAGNDQFPFFDAHPASSVLQAINKIVATKVHRVWVTDPVTHRLIGVVSLTDLIKLFYEQAFIATEALEKEAMLADELAEDDEM